MSNINELDLSVLDKLSPEEKALALSILQEYSQEGKSDQLNNLLLEDYAEVPVDIITFLHDPDYLGKGLTTDEGKFTVFPYWEKTLQQLFPNNLDTAYNTLILSGAIGLGKSFVAVIAMLYMLYRMLCLKDPYKHFGLQPIDHITFSIMNITLEAAKGVAWSKIQELLQLSPWFMSHGHVSKSMNPEWQPDSNIELIYGSQPRHVIGRAVYCLAGDTEICTSEGIIKLEDAVGKDLQVYSMDNNKNIVLSEKCNVQPTIKTNDYYEIELEDGSIIKCTGNHKFLLKSGEYKAASELTESDDIEDRDVFGFVYKIINKINNKFYIGVSVHPKERFYQHCRAAELPDNPGFNLPIHRAIRKYGKENFYYEVIDLAYSKDMLNNLEVKYIEQFQSQNPCIGYNVADGGQGGDGGPAVRLKISAKLRGRKLSKEHCEKISKVNKGKHLSEKTKEKIRSKLKGRKISEDTRQKISEAAYKRDKSNYPSRIGYRWITNGINSRQVPPDMEIPEGWRLGTMTTAGYHDMSRLTPEWHAHRSELSKKEKNPMWGKGYLRIGGNNTNAKIRYFFKNKSFECRIDLVAYLKENIHPDASYNLIRNIIAGTYKKRTENKFKEIIESLRWEIKNEN